MYGKRFDRTLRRAILVFLVMSLQSCALFHSSKHSVPAHINELVTIEGEISSANPSLGAQFYSLDGVEKKELYIQEMTMDVRLIPGFAETKVEIWFWNPADEEVEAELLFDLPAGALVTGYGLDIEGHMIPGVLVAQPVANRAYEARVRGNIDPGIAEIRRDNSFRNRVYPVPARGYRRVSIDFISPISEQGAYVLPLKTAGLIGRFSLDIQQHRGTQEAQVEFPEIDNLFVSKRDGMTRVTATQAKIDGQIEITPGAEPDQITQRHPNGELFAMASLPSSPAVLSKQRLETLSEKGPETLRVYWDRSLSGEASSKSERTMVKTLLSDLLLQLPDSEIELRTFNSSGMDGKQVLDLDSIDAGLDIRYHGGTDLSLVFSNESQGTPADLCLLVSDGRVTQGGFPEQSLPCPLVVISQSNQADRGFLQELANRNAGRFIDLTRVVSESQNMGSHGLAERILTSGKVIEKVLINGDDRTDQSIWVDTGEYIRVVAPVKETDIEMLVYTNMGIEKYTLDKPVDGLSLGAWWGSQRLNALRFGSTTQEQRVDMARKFSFATEEAAFAVFEFIEDYVENDIPLPNVSEEISEAMGWQSYPQLLAEYQADKRSAQESRLDEVVLSWQKQINWYETVFTFEENWMKEAEISMNAEPVLAYSMDSAPPPDVQTNAQDNLLALEEVIVTGRMRSDDVESDQPAIQVKAWTPDRPYLNALSGLCGLEFREVYFDLLPIQGTTPAFFLETADAAYQCGEQGFAREIVSSALELDLATEETKLAVAQRLLKYGDSTAAIDLFHQIASFDPLRPQPWRDLALGYASRARDVERPKSERITDFRKALNYLNVVIAQPQFESYEGIELIALNEANLIITELLALGEREHPIDSRLVKLMDVDLRIVVTWNRDVVDLDLRVTEPHGEEVFYGNRLSYSGGKLSNDMTEGYGPEEYLIRKAQAGEYSASINYFSSDFLNPNGPVISKIELYKNWGRANQSKAVTYTEFISDKEEDAVLGTVRFSDE